MMMMMMPQPQKKKLEIIKSQQKSLQCRLLTQRIPQEFEKQWWRRVREIQANRQNLSARLII